MHGESSKPGNGKICSTHETGQWSMLCIAMIVAGSHHVLEAGGNKIVCAHVNFKVKQRTFSKWTLLNP